MSQIIAVVGIVVLVIAGLITANKLVDLGVDVYLTRRIPAALGGAAYLVAILWTDATMAIVLSAVISSVIIVYRFTVKKGLRGVKGSLSSQPWVEITYLVSATVSLIIGWGILGDAWLAFLPIAFMAWGDTISGLVSEFLHRRNRRIRLWPSLAMLVTCLVCGGLYSPYWIAAIGATVATVAEKFPPKISGIQDDNWIIIGASLGVMAAIQAS